MWGCVLEETMAIGTEVFQCRCCSSMTTGFECLAPTFTQWRVPLPELWAPPYPLAHGLSFFFFVLFLNNFMPQDLQSAAITATSPSDWPLFVGGGALLGTAGLAQCPPLSAIRHSAPPVWSVGLSVHWCSFGAPPHSPFACVLFICSCDPHQICQRFRCRSFSPFALLPFCSFYHARTHE